MVLPPLSSNDWRPRYREAYPHLDIVEAKSALKRGHSICEFTEPWSEVRGWARCEIIHDRCQLWYDLDVRHVKQAKNSIIFELVPTSNGIVNCRMMLRCPECGRGKRSLFFKDKWACQSCLGLLFRSQVVSPIAVKFEKLKELNEKLEKGRPHGMHNKTYFDIVAKKTKLQQELYGIRPIVASDKFNYILSNNWREDGSNDDGRFSHHTSDTDTKTGRTYEKRKAKSTSDSSFELGAGLRQDYLGGYETGDADDL